MIYPTGHCTACAWATDAFKCTAAFTRSFGNKHARAAQAYINQINQELKDEVFCVHPSISSFTKCMTALEEILNNAPTVGLSDLRKSICGLFLTEAKDNSQLEGRIRELEAKVEELEAEVCRLKGE
ncbi:hypothetical protein V502_09942 [Pseudogymnoascus sp. VKM F-4520 (FW-2644)]|nr:hypothetical protein V502_09942 [Pseudogymnoascus sp. VKM F-4520 (FW-2644)]